MKAPRHSADIALMRPPDLLRALLTDPDARRRSEIVAALSYLRTKMTPAARRRVLDRSAGGAETQTEIVTT